LATAAAKPNQPNSKQNINHTQALLGSGAAAEAEAEAEAGTGTPITTTSAAALPPSPPCLPTSLPPSFFSFEF